MHVINVCVRVRVYHIPENQKDAINNQFQAQNTVSYLSFALIYLKKVYILFFLFNRQILTRKRMDMATHNLHATMINREDSA